MKITPLGNVLLDISSSYKSHIRIKYTYDYDNRLIQVEDTEGLLVKYKYDPFGRRIQKEITVNGTLSTIMAWKIRTT